MIPKIIHFVWVGTKPKPDIVKRCMASWKQYCPDYDVIEWGGAKLDEVDCAYVQEAASVKKWAFVSDYMRLFALYKQGGFYFDTDLELTANIDRFRSLDFVTGFEGAPDEDRVRPITAFMGSTPANPIIERLLAEYEGLSFLKRTGALDLTTNTRRISKNFEREFGLTKKKYGGGVNTVYLDSRSAIFPYYYFCTPKLGRDNFSIHHMSASWKKDIDERILCTFCRWQIVKFKHNKNAKPVVPERYEILWKFSIPGKKIATLAMVRRRIEKEAQC